MMPLSLIHIFAGALNPKLGSGHLDDDSLYLYESVFGVDETIERIEKILAEKSIPVFARIDHGKNAREAGLEMPPSKVVILDVYKRQLPGRDRHHGHPLHRSRYSGRRSRRRSPGRRAGPDHS